MSATTTSTTINASTATLDPVQAATKALMPFFTKLSQDGLTATIERLKETNFSDSTLLENSNIRHNRNIDYVIVHRCLTLPNPLLGDEITALLAAKAYLFDKSQPLTSTQRGQVLDSVEQECGRLNAIATELSRG